MNNSTPDMNELLVQYLDGEIQGEEKSNLEKQLAADAALQQQYDSLLLTRESIRYYGLQQKVASIHEEMMKEMKAAPVKPISNSRRTLRYALSVAASLLLLVGGYIAYQFFTLSPDKVFTANYQPYELSSTRDVNTAESASEKTYRAGNYKEVIRLYTAKEETGVKAAFLSGVSAMQVKDFTTAINNFTAVLDMNKGAAVKTLNDDAEYYLALSYIHTRDYDYALELMDKIKQDPAHTYHSKVTKKMIRQVKMLKWR
jgi:tetratricopeptide (TPR) repeat protein